jgi:hypothetical protein
MHPGPNEPSMMSTKIKQVRFCRKIKVRRVQNRTDISDDEMKASRYSRQDYECMRNQTKELASHLSGSFHVDVLRSRGLEPSKVKRQKHVTIRNGQLVVLLEQEQQWDGGRGVIHPRALARIATTFTKSSVDEAMRRGAIAQQEVRNQETKRPTFIRRSVSDTPKLGQTSVTAARRSCRRCASDTSKLEKPNNVSPHRSSSRSLSRPVSSFHRWRHLSVVPPRL